MTFYTNSILFYMENSNIIWNQDLNMISIFIQSYLIFIFIHWKPTFLWSRVLFHLDIVCAQPKYCQHIKGIYESLWICWIIPKNTRFYSECGNSIFNKTIKIWTMNKSRDICIHSNRICPSTINLLVSIWLIQWEIFLRFQKKFSKELWEGIL